MDCTHLSFMVIKIKHVLFLKISQIICFVVVVQMLNQRYGNAFWINSVHQMRPQQ